VAGISDRSGFRELGRLDGRYLSTEVAGGFTGRMIGIVSDSDDAVIKSFVYRGSDQNTDWESLGQSG
jgi:hypothetical protein